MINYFAISLSDFSRVILPRNLFVKLNEVKMSFFGKKSACNSDYSITRNSLPLANPVIENMIIAE